MTTSKNSKKVGANVVQKYSHTFFCFGFNL